MIYTDTNFFTNLLIPMVHHEEAKRLAREIKTPLPVTWLLRIELVNALQQSVFLSRHGALPCRVSPEFATAMEAQFFDEVRAGRKLWETAISHDSICAMFHDLSHRHTAREGFRTYDILHVASALVLGCDTFWSFDAKAKKLARLEGLTVN